MNRSEYTPSFPALAQKITRQFQMLNNRRPDIGLTYCRGDRAEARPTNRLCARSIRPPGMAGVQITQGAVICRPPGMVEVPKMHDSMEGGGRAKQEPEPRSIFRPVHPWTCAALAHDLQGWRKCWNCKEQFQCPAPAAYDHQGWWKCRECRKQFPARPSMDMRRSCASLRPRHTVHPWT